MGNVLRTFHGDPPDPVKPRHAACRGKNIGHTIPELMTVLAVVSILTVMAVPDLRHFISRNHVNRQADKLIAVIDRTRELAMEDGYPWRMCLAPGRGSWLCYGDKNENSRMDPEEKRLGPFELEGGVAFGCHALKGPNNTGIPDDGVSFQDDRITFSPMGCCVSGTIYLKDKRRSIAVRVLSASGVIREWQHEKGWEVLK